MFLAALAVSSRFSASVLVARALLLLKAGYRGTKRCSDKLLMANQIGARASASASANRLVADADAVGGCRWWCRSWAR